MEMQYKDIADFSTVQGYRRYFLIQSNKNRRYFLIQSWGMQYKDIADSSTVQGYRRYFLIRSNITLLEKFLRRVVF